MSAQSEQQCAQAASKVDTGQMSRANLSMLLSCERERGPALASGLRDLAFETDTAALRNAAYAAGLLVDADVNMALRDVAAAGSAPARALAISALIMHEKGEYSLISSESSACRGASVRERHQIRGKPLPSGHTEATYDLAQSIANDASTPSLVRYAATCLAEATFSLERVQRAPLPPVDLGRSDWHTCAATDSASRMAMRHQSR